MKDQLSPAEIMAAIRDLQSQLHEMQPFGDGSRETERLYTIIGKRIKERREQLQLSQEQVAVFAKVTRASIANIESGKQKTPIDRLYAYCVGLGLSPHDVLPTLDELNEVKADPR